MDTETTEVKFWCRESKRFLMYLSLPGLYRLPMKKVRKVFRLMHSLPERNEEAIAQTAAWLEEEVRTAQLVAEMSEAAFHRGYDAAIDPRSRSPTTAQQRLRNAELAESVRRAQLDLKKVQRLQKEFSSERKI